MFTSITLDDAYAAELAQTIVGYLKRKKVKKVRVHVLEELKKPTIKVFSENQFESLKILIQDVMQDEGRNFFLNVPEISTSFEEFSYGVEANSHEADFETEFDRYKAD